MSALYALVAAALIYALPLFGLRDEPLFPAMRASLEASARTVFAHLPLVLVVLAPSLAAAPFAAVSEAAAVVLEIGLGGRHPPTRRLQPLLRLSHTLSRPRHRGCASNPAAPG